MPAQAQTRLSPDEYLAIERQADAKSEYVDGEMFAMARVSPTHALIVANLCGELRQALRDRACFVFSTTCGSRSKRVASTAIPTRWWCAASRGSPTRSGTRC